MDSPQRGAALVTGASRGIGRAVALRIGALGRGVIVSARGRADCERVREEIRAAGGRAEVLELDVGDPASIGAAAERAGELGLGPVEWLVNNAGIAESAPLLRGSERDARGEDLYERHLRVDFHGARRVTEAFLPAMLAAGSGRVVHVASSAGLRGYAYVSAYCAAKHALLGYARAAALELAARGVTTNVVCPHYVDTPLTRASAERIAAVSGRSVAQALERLAAENPGGRLVTPEEVAAAVVALLEGQANGRVIELDGSGEPKESWPMEDVSIVQPAGWPAPKGYSNGVLAPSGARLLSIAGQIGWDAEGRMVGEDFAVQFAQALRNVLAVLRAAGGRPAGLLSLRIYVTDKRAYLERLRELGTIWQAEVGRHYPAMALVQVADLVEEGARVEIEALAAVP